MRGVLAFLISVRVFTINTTVRGVQGIQVVQATVSTHFLQSACQAFNCCDVPFINLHSKFLTVARKGKMPMGKGRPLCFRLPNDKTGRVVFCVRRSFAHKDAFKYSVRC